MDSATERKILSNKTRRVNIEDIKIGDIVNLCEDSRGNLLVVDTKSNVIKKILSNGDESSSAILKKGNTFSVLSVDEFLLCFGQVASIEKKTKNSPVTLKFKEKIKGNQEHTFKTREKIRKVI